MAGGEEAMVPSPWKPPLSTPIVRLIEVEATSSVELLLPVSAASVLAALFCSS